MLDDTSDGPMNEYNAERLRKLHELQRQFEKGKKDKSDEASSHKSM